MAREREREGGMGPVSLPLNIYKDLHFFRIFRQKMGQTERQRKSNRQIDRHRYQTDRQAFRQSENAARKTGLLALDNRQVDSSLQAVWRLTPRKPL